jgi:hypothetical protein
LKSFVKYFWSGRTAKKREPEEFISVRWKALSTDYEGERKFLRRNDLGHLTGIDDNISHHEPTDEYRGGNNPRDPRIVFSQFDTFNIMGNQFINFEG